uniref:HAT C-terminal dimerisation domain-containing protein n=1 Tax=Chelonoidis abingdonii TaxID=106734 RepID=A0A8C0GU92_CHEAB
MQALETVLTHDDMHDIDVSNLSDELKAISRYISAGSTPKAVLEYICTNKMTTLFPNAFVALSILLTLPITVASGERSFSKLKLIKTQLRSTVTEERLVSLAAISVEHDQLPIHFVKSHLPSILISLLDNSHESMLKMISLPWSSSNNSHTS